MPADHLSINGEPRDIVDPSRLKTGRRNYTESMRPSQPTDPGVQKKAVWKLSGIQFGLSRELIGPNGEGGLLAVDYVNDLDHSNEGTLISAPNRNAVSLTSITANAYGVPISDITKTNWSEGAGDGDGSAFDELDEGIDSGTPDDATTYWTTTSNGNANKLQCGVTSLTDPAVDTGTFAMRFRVRGTDGDNVVYELAQGTTSIYSTILDLETTNAWATVELIIPESAVATITDFTALRLGLYKFSGSNSLDCSAMEMEVPNGKYGPVKYITQSYGYPFAYRGAYATQINPGDMTEIENNDRTNQITDALGEWQGAGFIARGTAAVIQKMTAATSGGATFADVTSVEAWKLAVGAGKAWIVDADSNNNRLRYTADAADITSAGLSNPINPIIDPGTDVTGLFANDEYSFVGFTRGVNSFTDAGKPSKLLPALKNFPSLKNATSHAHAWGWDFITTELGLFALDVGNKIANPVGPGEGQIGRLFEGPLDGYPTAVFEYRDELMVAYLNPDGTTYLFRGLFNASVTPGSGRPDWYSFRTLAATECHAIGITTGRDNPTMIVGENDDIAYYTRGRRSREIADPNYTFSVGGGTWYGTTMMRNPDMLKVIRFATVHTDNCDANNTWQLAVQMNDGVSGEAYVDIGSATTSDGLHYLHPISGSDPIVVGINGTFMKPRLTQVADSGASFATTAPTIYGPLTIWYDERPNMIREASVVVEWQQDGDLAELQALTDRATAIPHRIRLPYATAVNEDTFGFVISAEAEDLKDPTDRAIRLTIQQWDIS